METIWHQGSVYDASAAAVPFIVEILDSPATQHKELLLQLLSALATGRGWYHAHQSAEAVRRAIPSAEIESNIKRERIWIDELRAELNRFTPSFVRCLEHPDGSVRREAAELFRSLPESNSHSVPMLLRCFESETNDDVRANLLRVLFLLDQEAALSVAETVAAGSDSSLTTLVALWALVPAAPNQAPPNVLDRFTEIVLTADDDLIARYHSLPSAGDFFADFGALVAVSSGPHAERIAGRYLEYVGDDPWLPDAVAVGLLCTVLHPGGAKPDLQHLTPLQQQAVAKIARLAWPDAMRTYANMVDVLERFGLPGRREDMAKLLPPGTIAVDEGNQAASSRPRAREYDHPLRGLGIVAAIGIAFVILAFAVVLISSSKQPRKQDRFFDDNGASLGSERERLFKIMKKTVDQLTNEDRNVLILFGFAKDDTELSPEDRFRLNLYGLEEARHIWRRHHKPLPKDYE